MNIENKTHVLLVENNATDAFILESLLADIPNSTFYVKHVTELSEAQSVCENEKPDVILLDISLPDAQGLNSIKELKSVAADSPILVISGNKDPDITDLAVQAGAYNLLRKGEYSSEHLGKTIRYAIDGKQSKSELKHLANFDSLTGIANRVLFINNMTRALSHAKRHNEMLSLLFIDLDDFTNINDTLGNAAGDEVLIQVADRLNSVVRECDTLARIGGDEFAIILEDAGMVYNVDVAAKKILHSLSAPFNLNNHEVLISASIGVAIYPEAGIDTNALLKNADFAMHQAKNKGKNNYHIFTESLDNDGLARIKMERDLQKALSRDEFELLYQPLIDVKSGEIGGVEALLRWNYPERDELVLPNEFISTLEKTGLIVPVGDWVLRTACEQCKRWHDDGMFDFRVAVNVSPRQFQQSDPAKWIAIALDETGLDGKFLNIEITEDILLQNPEHAKENIKRIRNMGVSISIDDFGTGYSSLSCLMNYELDILKIDRSFLNTLTTNPSTPVIIQAIIQMAHGLGLQVIAEGVEQLEQYDYLEAQNCDVIQGYLFGEPIEAQALFEFIEESYTIKKLIIK